MDASVNGIYTEENTHRLLKAVMQKRGLEKPSEAEEFLLSLRLSVVCGDKIHGSAALQAALLTTVNAGKRAFLGGVIVSMPPKVALLLPWPDKKFLNNVVTDLGGVAGETKPDETNFTLTLGFGIEHPHSLELLCNGWVGGVTPFPDLAIPSKPDFALGGILAAGLGVGCAFLKASGIEETVAFQPFGLSLWRPDVDWLSSEASGPEYSRFPKRIWLLGVGHLGQAYLWSLGLLSIPETHQVELMLQDFDLISEANFSTGLLSEKHNVGKYKTRNAADWLEARKFKTKITERRFDENTKRNGEEPYLALCGFDSSGSRRFIEDAGFDAVVECALGASLEDFDKFSLHVFPASRKAKEIWSVHSSQVAVDPKIVKAFERETEKKNGCGIIAHNLAQKAISSSFVGCIAGPLVVSELLRGWHGGVGFEALSGQLRCISDISTVPSRNEAVLWAKNGYVGSPFAQLTEGNK